MDIGQIVYHFGEWLKVWVSVIADTVTVVALVGAFFGWRSFAHRRMEAEKAAERARAERETWWRRVQWAIDLGTSDDPGRQHVGIKALEQFAQSELTTAEDLELMEALTGVRLGEVEVSELSRPVASVAADTEEAEREG